MPVREHESRSRHQNPVQDVSEFSAIAHTEAKPGQTFDLQLQLERRKTGGGMTLWQRVKAKDQSRGTASARSGAKMCPMVAKGPQNDFWYVPWSFMDMITLAGKWRMELTSGLRSSRRSLEGSSWQAVISKRY